MKLEGNWLKKFKLLCSWYAYYFSFIALYSQALLFIYLFIFTSEIHITWWCRLEVHLLLWHTYLQRTSFFYLPLGKCTILYWIWFNPSLFSEYVGAFSQIENLLICSWIRLVIKAIFLGSFNHLHIGKRFKAGWHSLWVPLLPITLCLPIFLFNYLALWHV